MIENGKLGGKAIESEAFLCNATQRTGTEGLEDPPFLSIRNGCERWFSEYSCSCYHYRMTIRFGTLCHEWSGYRQGDGIRVVPFTNLRAPLRHRHRP